jgi:YHS domain-containing protein
MPTRRLVLAMLALVTFVIAAAPARAEDIKKVASKRVCMVNNTLFDKDQIPVAVDGKTYFGCCEMCKGRLAQDASIRESVDPISGKPVDKAKAVIGAKPDGKVLYFESDKTFAAYQKRKPS